MAARHRQSGARPASVLSSASVPWLPVLVGIGVMAGFVIYGLTLQVGSDQPFEVPVEAGARHTAEPPTQPPPPPEPSPTPSPPPPPTTEPPPPPPPPPTTEPPPATTDAPPATTEPPPPDVIGKYQVVHLFEHEFTAKIVVINRSDHAQDWTVKLVYPDSVGELRDFWIDGGQQPSVRSSGSRHVFNGAVPVAPRSHVVLKVQFARTGADVAPTVCKVNGTPCVFP